MKTSRIRIPFIILAAVPAVYFFALKASEPVALEYIRPAYMFNFSLVWIFFALALLVPAFPDGRIAKAARRLLWGARSRRIATAAVGGIFGALSLALAVWIMLPAGLSEQTASASAPAYLLVLGCGVLPDGRVSDMLRSRLDAAAAYRERHPNARIVVSGGQGINEPVPEAAAMSKYIAERAGIAENAILAESGSKDTIENMANSRDMIGRDAAVIVLTNEFHLKRAMLLARAAGFADLQGIAAPCPAIQLPNALLREVGSWWKLGMRAAASALGGGAVLGK